MDRYSSIDSSDTFLSCNTHPFPSQGSLAGLEELAAKGSMAANGSMPSVNISGINSVYVNPFEPPNKRKVAAAGPAGGLGLTPSPKASPYNSRRAGVGGRYSGARVMSSDTDETWADALDHEDNVFRELRQEADGQEDAEEEEQEEQDSKRRRKVQLSNCML